MRKGPKRTTFKAEFMGSQYVCDAALPSGCAQCGEAADAFVHDPSAVSRTGKHQHEFEEPRSELVKQRMKTRAYHRESGQGRVCRTETGS